MPKLSNFIDTADVYSAWKEGNQGGESETIIGNWVSSKGNRDQVVIATKVALLETRKGLSAANIALACEDSLRRLKTDYIDIYYAHTDDLEAPLEETLDAFNKLVTSGKVRYIAASNYTFDRLGEALAISEANSFAKYIALQNRYSLVAREPYESDGTKSVQTYGVSGLPYSTLGSGFLSGKYQPGVQVSSARAEGVSNNYANDENFALLKRLTEVADKHEVSTTAVSLEWLRNQPGVTVPIASGRTIEQLDALMQSVTLSSEELTFIAG
ncbi:MAG: aldo/keto reductase [Micrococcales bacterium]|nr:aldo/keto reductase [Micrococcales bacterium]